MLPEEVRRRAMAEARRRKVSFASFVRKAICDQLPQHGRDQDPLRERRRDPLFRLTERLPLVTARTPPDVAEKHDDYLYGEARGRASR